LIRPLLIAFSVAVGLWLVLILGLVVAGRRSHAKELATLLPNLIRLFRGLMGDPRVARRTKWLLLVGVFWFASPIDLIPEFIPVIGPLDDAVVAGLILRHIVKVAGPDVVEDHWKGDPSTLRRVFQLMRLGAGPTDGEPFEERRAR
jgi:uncharacterized membrane protein YkvA (DUF1232 family)